MGRLNRWLDVFSPHKAQAADSMKKGHPEEFAGLRKLALSAQATDFPEKAGKHGVFGVLMEKLKKINPRYIFFPHWSWIILAFINFIYNPL